MKHFIIFTLIISLVACNRNMHPTSNRVTVKGTTLLLGKVSIDQLQQAPFADWYNKGYTDYQPDAKVTDSLQQLVKPYRFELFMGTWCGDSKREVPRIMKLLHAIHVRPSAITIIGVGNRDTLYKQSPSHEERGKSVYRVPHLRIVRDGVETGIITETPVTSWEKDLMAILSGRPYTPVYPKKAG